MEAGDLARACGPLQASRSGQRWISLTQVQGRSVLRMMIISYLTKQRHVEELEAALLAAAPR